jgi:hypothetical protein
MRLIANVALIAALAASACGGSEHRACSVVPASPSPVTSPSDAEATGAGGLWSWDGLRWRWLASEPATTPGTGGEGGIAWDPQTSQLVNVNEIGTQLWDGEKWLSADPSGPRGFGAQLVYDEVRHEVVMYGGASGSTLSGTWTWDEKAWHEKGGVQPDPIGASNIVWDNVRKMVVMYAWGGEPGHVVPQTWGWNGSTWSELPGEKAPLRGSPSLAFNAADGTVVMFGGDQENGPNIPNSFSRETWTWDGSVWTQHHPPHSPTITDNSFSMGYVADHHVVVLIGFAEGGTETWIWNGVDWIRQEAAIAPKPHEFQVEGHWFSAALMPMTYDSQSQRLLLLVVSPGVVPYYGPCYGGLP